MTLSRRTGQKGSVFQKGKKAGEWNLKAPAYGRYWIDIPGQQDRQRKIVPLGICKTRSIAVHKLGEHIEAEGINSTERQQEAIAPATTFQEQAAWWLAEIRAGRILHGRTRGTIRPATIAAYETAVAYLNVQIGDMPLASIDNAEAKELIAKMKAATKNNKVGETTEAKRFSDKTIVNYFLVVRAVIASAVSRHGEQTHPRKWNLNFICLPAADPKNQHSPTLTREEITEIVSLAKGRYRVLYALLTGTGMRISEALGLEVGKHISSDGSIISIRQQRGKKKGEIEPFPKTDAGFRDIDLHPFLTTMLRDYIGDRKEGFLFETENGKPLSPQNIYRDSLKSILKMIGQQRVRFHAFRRFRESVLLRSEARNLLINFWIGHADKEMSSRYGKQLKEDVEFRQEWAARVGLGFDLPTSDAALVGQLGQPEASESRQKEAA